MRTHGTLAKWNDDRGFGFIAPAEGKDEIFVHASAFPKDGVRPRVNEVISFETETGPNGKLRAIRVMRPGRQAASTRPRPRPRVTPRQERSAGPSGMVLGLLLIVAIGAYGYSRFSASTPELPVAPAAMVSTAPPAPSRCDGRTMCSQMTSCAEARYFLQHCPNTQMDGNNDGEPCEQQWCN
ncbi:MAG: cold shock domain-containing protein [Pseudoxanthomonas sp.]